jgi:hypothetical protein
MAFYAFLAIGLAGVLRWPIWCVPPLIVAAILVSLGLGSRWSLESWQPLNNPIFIDLVLKLIVIYAVACMAGYGFGRLVAFVWRRLTHRGPRADSDHTASYPASAR